ncbi:MAG: hypothetical protein HYW51_02985 [Candidatus Doudnabacteria bacterium]|nr:hypothetical protein [Candidatus Doudnabacteria bacterium]
MPKQTTSRKKKTHSLSPHRWLIWTLSIAVFIAIGLVGYIVVTNENFDREVVGNLNEVNAWRTYQSKNLGFSLRYPNDWVLESPADNIILFESDSIANEQVSVSVQRASDETAIRAALDNVSEVRVPIGGIDGPRIVNQLSTGQEEIVVLVRPDSRLFVIRGTSSIIDDIISTVKFINE